MMIDFPFGIDKRGRTATTNLDDHVLDMIEQVLFTTPSERVERPDFGCGLADLVFGPNSPELAAAVQVGAQGALQRWLGDVITIDTLTATADESTLEIVIAYTITATGTTRTDTITGKVG